MVSVVVAVNVVVLEEAPPVDSAAAEQELVGPDWARVRVISAEDSGELGSAALVRRDLVVAARVVEISVDRARVRAVSVDRALEQVDLGRAIAAGLAARVHSVVRARRLVAVIVSGRPPAANSITSLVCRPMEESTDPDRQALDSVTSVSVVMRESAAAARALVLVALADRALALVALADRALALVASVDRALALVVLADRALALAVWADRALALAVSADLLVSLLRRATPRRLRCVRTITIGASMAGTGTRAIPVHGMLLPGPPERPGAFAPGPQRLLTSVTLQRRPCTTTTATT